MSPDPAFWKIRKDDIVILNPSDGPHRILRYGIQPTPTTCPHCGAPRTCCGGATIYAVKSESADSVLRS